MNDLIVLTASNGENLKLAERFASNSRNRGLKSAVLDLTAIDSPLYTPRSQAHGIPAGIMALSQQLAAAKRWVICTPEYNGGIPPVLTSTIAWLSLQGDDFRTLFNNRPVVIATHSGSGGYHVLMALRIQMAYLGALVVGRQLVSNQNSPAKDSSIDDLITRLLLLSN